jgi:hypothetical protein
VVQLNEKQFALRHVKEKSEAAQELVQRIESGLSHIGDLLGVEKREEDQTSSVGDLLRDIETALDTVLDEREKQLQQQAGQQTGQASSGGSPALLAIPGTESLRSPFSRANTSQYEANRAHLDMGFDVTKSFSKARGQKKRAKGGDHPQKTKSSSPRDSDDEVRRSTANVPLCSSSCGIGRALMCHFLPLLPPAAAASSLCRTSKTSRWTARSSKRCRSRA